MLLFENPVLQRELITNLRTNRAFVLMFVYQVALAVVVLIAYPREARLDLTENSATAKKLVDFFFVGQYVLASLMAPSFAAGAISGEKERKTYEMLLASPLRPAAIVIGKMVASLTHLLMLIVGSLPTVMLCLPLGGVSIYEVLAAYLGLIMSITLFGAIGLTCSSYFKRTASSLVVSYLIILPLVLIGTAFWLWLSNNANLRLWASVTVLPLGVVVIVFFLCRNTAQRLLYPPDIGSGGNEVVDLENENKEAIGLVINRDQFPDRFFAPPRRQTLMRDGVNPIYDKEIHAELFSQGTLMLRLVIQISMVLAIPLMAWLLFIQAQYTGWYMMYVIVFNMLVAPVFSAGSLTSERERQTLDLLLTTIVKPSFILWGKLLAGFRVSFVLTMFLMWPVVLAVIMNSAADPVNYLARWASLLAFVGIVIVTCVFNSVVALFCSSIFRKTSVAMIMSYVALLTIYALPVSLWSLSQTFDSSAELINTLYWACASSPIMACMRVPMDLGGLDSNAPLNEGIAWNFVGVFFLTLPALTVVLLGIMTVMFNSRWRMNWRGV